MATDHLRGRLNPNKTQRTPGGRGSRQRRGLGARAAGGAHSCTQFSKVSALARSLNQVSIERTFEDVCLHSTRALVSLDGLPLRIFL